MSSMLITGAKVLGKAWKGTSKKLIEFGKRHADPDAIALDDLSNLANNKLDASKAGNFKNFLRQKRTSMGQVQGLNDAAPNFNPVRYVKTRGAKTLHDVGKMMEDPLEMIKKDIRNSKYHAVKIDGKTHLARAGKRRRLWNFASSPTGFGVATAATIPGGFSKRTSEGTKEYAMWRLSPQTAFGKMIYDFNKNR